MITIVLDNNESHLFRHASEITKETKGGYITGSITLPKLSIPYFLRLSLVPAQLEAERNPLNVHPLLLHLNAKLGKKQRQLDHDDGHPQEEVDWSFVLHIDKDGAVHLVNDKTRPRFGYSFKNNELQISKDSRKRKLDKNGIASEVPPQFLAEEAKIKSARRQNIMNEKKESLCQGPMNLVKGWTLTHKIVDLKAGDTPDSWTLELGSSGLMLNVITPLQKYNNGGITLLDVLWQRFSDLHQRTASRSLLAEMEDIFTKEKEDRVKLQQVRLLLEVFVAGRQPRFWGSSLSNIIANSKSKECGPLRLHDVNPNACCAKGDVRIYILSHFKLIANIRARFIVWNAKKKEIVNVPNHVLRQPETSSVFNQFILMFNTPAQDMDLLEEHVYSKGLEIRVTAFRPNDCRLSSTSFEFRYLRHGHGTQPGSGVECLGCEILRMKPDTVVLPPARPGQHRRAEKNYYTYDETTREVSEARRKKPTADVQQANLEPPAPASHEKPASVERSARVDRKCGSKAPEGHDFSIVHVPTSCDKLLVVKKDPEEIFAITAASEPTELLIKEEPEDVSEECFHLTLPVPPRVQIGHL